MRVLSLMSDFPAWRSGIRRRSPQSIWLWRPVELDWRSSTELGKETPLLDGTYTLGPKAKQWLHRTLSWTSLQVLEGLLGRQGWAMAHSGARKIVTERPLGIFFSVSSLRGHPFGTMICPHPKACRLQCWDTSVKQPTGWKHSLMYEQTGSLKSPWAHSHFTSKYTTWHGPAHQRDNTHLHPPMVRH